MAASRKVGRRSSLAVVSRARLFDLAPALPVLLALVPGLAFAQSPYYQQQQAYQQQAQGYMYQQQQMEQQRRQQEAEQQRQQQQQAWERQQDQYTQQQQLYQQQEQQAQRQRDQQYRDDEERRRKQLEELSWWSSSVDDGQYAADSADQLEQGPASNLRESWDSTAQSREAGFTLAPALPAARFWRFAGAGVVLFVLAAGWVVILGMVRRRGFDSIWSEFTGGLMLGASDAKRLGAQVLATVKSSAMRGFEAAKPALSAVNGRARKFAVSVRARLQTEPAEMKVAAHSSGRGEVKPGFAEAILHATSSATQSAPVIARFTTRPMQGFVFSVDTSDAPRAHSRAGRAALSPKPRSVHLRCASCEKHYRVKGDIGERQLPCPACGSALDVLDGALRTTVATISEAAPIVSVVCQQCTAIIDAPSSAIGTAIPCPRCQAELTVRGAQRSNGFF